jgi:hypothetical protein
MSLLLPFVAVSDSGLHSPGRDIQAILLGRIYHSLNLRNIVLVCLEQAHEKPCLPREQEHLNSLGIRIENGWVPRSLFLNQKKAQRLKNTD